MELFPRLHLRQRLHLETRGNDPTMRDRYDAHHHVRLGETQPPGRTVLAPRRWRERRRKVGRGSEGGFDQFYGE